MVSMLLKSMTKDVQIPERKEVGYRKVACALNLQRGQLFKTVTGATFSSMRSLNETREIFICFQAMLVSMKRLNEMFPPLASDTLSLIGESIVDASGSLAIDLRSLTSRSPSVSEKVAKELKHSQLSPHMTARLEGKSPLEAFQDSLTPGSNDDGQSISSHATVSQGLPGYYQVPPSETPEVTTVRRVRR